MPWWGIALIVIGSLVVAWILFMIGLLLYLAE